jgi:transposase-like protein
MESIPEQHIEALPGATRKEAYDRIGLISVLRDKRTYSEQEIAKKAGFGGAEAMYQWLKTWRLSGLIPPDKQEGASKPKATKPGPSARTSSPPEDVVNANAAADLFNDALDGLMRVVENLEDLNLSYQGKRFVGSYTLTGRWTFLRNSYSEQGWKEVCEEYGQDPLVETFSVDGLSGSESLRVSRYPPRDVVALIAAYALSDRPLELLLEALYPGYTQEDLEEVRKLFYQTQRQDDKDGLRRTAEQFAAAVYGRKVGKGIRPEESPRKHRLACYITAQREVGVPDEEILQHIRDKGYELSKEEFDRLASLELRFANT